MKVLGGAHAFQFGFSMNRCSQRKGQPQLRRTKVEACNKMLQELSRHQCSIGCRSTSRVQIWQPSHIPLALPGHQCCIPNLQFGKPQNPAALRSCCCCKPAVPRSPCGLTFLWRLRPAVSMQSCLRGPLPTETERERRYRIS